MAEEIKSSDLINRALDNIISDRKKLEDLYDSLEGLATEEPSALALVGDNLVKIVDSLTKQTGQIVELAKLKQKAAPAASDEGLDSDDQEALYDQIENIDEDAKEYS